MLTKIQRFAQWRGTKDLEEQSYINTALIAGNYLGSVTTTDAIKTEFSSPQSVIYNELNKYGARGLGLILYVKLEVDEALENIPATGILERNLLTDLLHILIEIYDKPRNNTTDKIHKLIACIKQLLALNAELFADKERVNVLFIDIYMVLSIINLALNKLTIAHRIAASPFISIDKMKQEITSLMLKTEKRVEQLNRLIVEQNQAQTPTLIVSKTTQDFFNERFLKLLKRGSNRDDGQQSSILENTLSGVTQALNRLIVKRNKKVEITVKIQQIQALLKEEERNEKKTRGRKLFLDLIDSNQELFDALMSNISGFKKKQLADKIEQLSTQGLYQKMTTRLKTGAHWVSSVISDAYLNLVQQQTKDSSAKVSLTLDNECTVILKDLAEDCLFTLNQKGLDTQKEIDRLTHYLSDGVIELEQRLSNESIDNLSLLFKANKAAKETMSHYRRISRSSEDKVLYLRVIQESNSALTSFIQTHDGFLVQLSNFFANISSIFKSDTAAMIDKAREMKARLEHFESIYQQALAEELNLIEPNSVINQAIKEKLQQKINTEMTNDIEIVPSTSPSKEDVRYLIYNLKKIFNMNRAIGVPEQSAVVTAESLAPSLC